MRILFVTFQILLDTPAKQQLCSIIRSVIPRQDVPLFDNMMTLDHSVPSSTVPRLAAPVGIQGMENAKWKSGAHTDSHITAGASIAQQTPISRYYQTLPTRGTRLYRSVHSSVVPSHAHVKPTSRFQLPSWGEGVPIEVSSFEETNILYIKINICIYFVFAKRTCIIFHYIRLFKHLLTIILSIAFQWEF